jgi:predicted HTH domain antitoxin
MPLTISDEVLESAGLTEAEARVEFACGLFDSDKLALWPAAQLAEMTRLEFEEELRRRNIPIYRPTVEDLQLDLAAFERLDAQR